MLDDNGYYVPDDPYLQQMNRQMSASGGVEPAQPEPQTNLDDYPGSPDKMGLPASPPPSPAQQTLKDRYGIGTFGSAADAAKRAAEAYRGGVDQYESATHQGMPQQYGTAEPTGQDNGPLDPSQAAEKYMANNPDDATAQLNNRKHTLGYGDRSSQNAAYAARTAADQKTRFESRNALREQGAMNRAASREKDADMWSQFRDMGAMQGAAPNARFSGGPMAGAQNVGGAILLPGMGAPPWSRRGGGAGMSPEQLSLHEQELAARIAHQKAMEDAARGRNDNNRERNRITEAGQEGINDRFNIVNGQRIAKSFDEKRVKFDSLIADYDRRSKAFLAAKAAGQDPIAAADSSEPVADPRNPGKYVPGAPYPGSFSAIKRRILALGTDLANENPDKFQVTPDVIEKWNNIKAAVDADQMGTPSP